MKNSITYIICVYKVCDIDNKYGRSNNQFAETNDRPTDWLIDSMSHFAILSDSQFLTFSRFINFSTIQIYFQKTLMQCYHVLASNRLLKTYSK